MLESESQKRFLSCIEVTNYSLKLDCCIMRVPRSNSQTFVFSVTNIQFTVKRVLLFMFV